MIANNAIAERLVAQLSKEEVAITANFDGSEIFIYGAIKHDESDKIISPLEVVITVSGPTEKLYVRKKSKHALIWLNTETIEIDSAPLASLRATRISSYRLGLHAMITLR